MYMHVCSGICTYIRIYIFECIYTLCIHINTHICRNSLCKFIKYTFEPYYCSA